MDFPHFTSSALNSSDTGDSSAVDPNASPATDILLFVVLPIAVGAVLVAAICWAIIKCQNRAKSTSKPAGKLKRRRGGIELQARDAEQRGQLGEAEAAFDAKIADVELAMNRVDTRSSSATLPPAYDRPEGTRLR